MTPEQVLEAYELGREYLHTFPRTDESWSRARISRLVTRIYFPDEADANAVDPVLSGIGDARLRSSLVATTCDDGSLRFDIYVRNVVHEVVAANVVAEPHDSLAVEQSTERCIRVFEVAPHKGLSLESLQSGLDAQRILRQPVEVVRIPGSLQVFLRCIHLRSPLLRQRSIPS